MRIKADESSDEDKSSYSSLLVVLRRKRLSHVGIGDEGRYFQ
jgi:hypothetical protein